MSKPSCKDGIVRFRTVPLKYFSDQVWNFCFFKLFIFHLRSLSESDFCAFLVYIQQWRNSGKTPLLELEKRPHLSHLWPNKGFKGTVMNQALPSLYGGSLEIKLTDFLIKSIHFHCSWKKIDCRDFRRNFERPKNQKGHAQFPKVLVKPSHWENHENILFFYLKIRV